MFSCLYYTNKIKYLAITKYHYRKHNNSITSIYKINKKKIIDKINIHTDIIEFLKQRNIVEKFNNELMIFFLLRTLPTIFLDYCRLPKKEIDIEVNKCLISIINYSVLNEKNISILHAYIHQFKSKTTYKPDYDYLMKSLNLLISIKRNFKKTLFFYRTIYNMHRKWIFIKITAYKFLR